MNARPLRTLAPIVALSLAGCAMDIVSVKQAPVLLTELADLGPPVILQNDVSVAIGTGFATKLRKGTTWRPVGRIAEGEVYATRDQIVTVEASHIHEARPVIAGGRIVGFYLPVERTFTRASSPVAVSFQSTP